MSKSDLTMESIWRKTGSSAAFGRAPAIQNDAVRANREAKIRRSINGREASAISRLLNDPAVRVAMLF